MIKLIKTERQKLRRRHAGLLYLLLLAVLFLWLCWCMRDRNGNMDAVVHTQGYYLLLINLPLMNSILLPVVLAAAESRLCDMEIRGNTLKMLCTMQHRQSIYYIKLLFGVFYLLAFTLAEMAMPFLLGFLFDVQQPIPWEHILYFGFSTASIGIVLVLLQQSLSLLSENQLLPLFIGIGGSFAGLFSAFFPQLPIRYLLPWGYFIVGSTVNLFYEQATRTTTYYPVPFPWHAWIGILLFGLVFWLAGKNKFNNKEV